MSDLSGEVLAEVAAWLPPNDEPDRPQIQVATVDEDGRPDLRTVLLSEWDERGFVFHTDARSRKADQLAARPGVAVLVLWPGFTRQLVVRGRAEPLDADRIAGGYAKRSPYLRQLAWLNDDELAQAGQEQRRARWAAAAGHDFSAPPESWTGYLVRPERLTFWRSDAEGPSHRVEYREEPGGGWSTHHLPG
ncbi:MAG TPA: pyridoxamine 5'-phosphate oxidase family protein [Amnibacterium sp.]|uniref:pyridoxamine 5'-phosphate oxidase family protein n=1 Tax=Amnibacterium sp. TaxID=1872496 RepID=UPI002F93C66F